MRNLWLACLAAGFVWIMMALAGCDHFQEPASLGNAPTPSLAPSSSPPAFTPEVIPGLPLLGLDTRASLIAFQSFRDGQDAIYIMDEDGANQHRVVSGVEPSWSPDGLQLAYCQVTSESDTIFVLDLVSGRQITLTRGFTPAWSPEGHRIAFVDSRNGNTDIFIINTDGTSEKQLTHHPAKEINPSWAPDGERLAFEREGQIVIVATDGHELAVISSPKTYASHPAWSPDGNRIAFSLRAQDTNGDGIVDPKDSSQIAVVNMDGMARTLFTELGGTAVNPVWAQHPAWSSDGAKLAFESNRDGKWDIFVIKKDGSDLKNLTGEVKDSLNVSPCWRPWRRN